MKAKTPRFAQNTPLLGSISSKLLLSVLSGPSGARLTMDLRAYLMSLPGAPFYPDPLRPPYRIVVCSRMGSLPSWLPSLSSTLDTLSQVCNSGSSSCSLRLCVYNMRLDDHLPSNSSDYRSFLPSLLLKVCGRSCEEPGSLFTHNHSFSRTHVHHRS